MGHKAHPVGLRLGIHRKWQSNWFFDSKNYAKFIHLNLNIEKFFKGFLYFYGVKTLLLKCQLIKLASNQLFIFVFYYRFRKKLKKTFYKWKINSWKSNLEDYFLQNEEIFQKYYPSLKQFSTGYYRNSIFMMKNIFCKKYKFLLKHYLQTNAYSKYILETNAQFMKTEGIIKNIKDNLTNYTLYYTLYKKNLISLENLTNLIQKFKEQLKLNICILKIIKNSNKLKKKLMIQQYFNQLRIYNYFFFKQIFVTNATNNDMYNIHCGLYLDRILCRYKKFDKFFKDIALKAVTWKKPLVKSIKKKKRKDILITKKNYRFSINQIKIFLSKLTNLKIKLIFINTLSFTKFFYLIDEESKKKKRKSKEKYNVLKIQKLMLNKFKYNAIFIKDFIHLAFIAILLKNTTCLVNFIAEQFKRLPKNRKQLKLLTFITQSLKIFCQQRKEFIGFKFQLKGRLNRRNRTNKWTFTKGNLPIQTYKTRVEYSYTEGFTRSGLIGIKLWFFYQKKFKKALKIKLIQYLYYSKYKKFLNKNFLLKKPFKNYAKTKSKKISKK